MYKNRAYRYGSPVGPPFFCDRERQTRAVADAILGGEHAFVLGPRRFGKSSVVRRAADVVLDQDKGALVGWADLSRCVGPQDVAAEVLRAVLRSIGRPERTLRRIEDALEQLRVRPSIGLGADGRLDISFDPMVVGRAWVEVFEDAVGLLAELSRRRVACLVVDEAQQVARSGMDPRLPGMLKSAADDLADASLVLCGSRQRVMDALVRRSDAPLYGMGKVVALGEIPEADICSYLVERADATGRRMNNDVALAVCSLGGPVPNYVQQLADAAWHQADAGVIDRDALLRGLDEAAALQQDDFASLLAELSPVQARVLRLLAAGPIEHPNASDFVAEARATARSVTLALSVLDDSGLALRRGRAWIVPNPFLRHWLAGDG